MKRQNKKALYESIMRKVAKVVKESIEDLDFNGRKLHYNAKTGKYDDMSGNVPTNFEDFCISRLQELIDTGSCTEMTPSETKFFKEYILDNLDWMPGYGHTDSMAAELSNSRSDACSDFCKFLETFIELYPADEDDEDTQYFHIESRMYDSTFPGLYLLECIYECSIIDNDIDDYCDTIIFEIEEEAGNC